MDKDWLADVRRFDANAEELVVAAIVRHCGIALQSRDASLVAFSDPSETDRVRESFLKKKLGRTEDDTVLDAAIAAVGDRMKEDHNKNRVTVYYLLAQHFDQLSLFGATAKASAGLAAAGAATGAAAASSVNNQAAPLMAKPKSDGGAGNASNDQDSPDDGLWGAGCLGGLAFLGAIAVAALISVWASNTVLYREPAPVAAPAPAPVTLTEPAVPEGAGVVATTRDEKPVVIIYFDSDSYDLHPDFGEASAPLMAYLEQNSDARAQISGFNDPTGSAELNAELSKNRAQAVLAGLEALGLDAERADLIKPDDTTREELSKTEARRVEVTIVDG